MGELKSKDLAVGLKHSMPQTFNNRSDISFEISTDGPSANASYDALMMGWHDGWVW